MMYIINIPKRDYTRAKITKLELALSILTQSDPFFICTDSSDAFCKISINGEGVSIKRAEQMKYFAIGFLNAPELE